MSIELIPEEIYSLSLIDENQFETVSVGIGVKQISDYLDKIGQIDLYKADQEIESAKDIEAGLYADSLLSAQDPNNSEFSDEEKANLQAMSERGRQSRNNFVEANLRLVASIAKSFKYNSSFEKHSFWDLVQTGNEALIIAAEKFDYTKGFRFSTYATWCIRDAIKKSSPYGKELSMSSNTVEKMNKLKAVAARLYGELGRYASNEEIATELNLRPNSVRELMLSGREPLRFEQTIGDGSFMTVGDIVVDSDSGWLAEQMARKDLQNEVEELLTRLTDVDREIVMDRYGFNETGEVMSVVEVREKQGLTKSQLELRQSKIMNWFRTDDRVASMIDYLYSN